MQDAGKILEALRPAHLPPAPEGFTFGDVALPVALGLFLALAVALLWPRRIRGRRRLAAVALEELRQSRALPAGEAAIAQARLLRRLVAARDGEQAGALRGDDFAAHLDRMLSTDFFTKGAGRRLATGLYEPTPGTASPDVAETLQALLKRVRR